MKRPALAFSPKRLAQPGSNARRAPTPLKKKLADLPAAPLPLPAAKPSRWANETPRFADDLLVGAISYLLRHEHDGQSVEDHDVSESVLACVEALCEFFEEQISPDTVSEEIQYKAGQILRLLEVSAESGESIHELMTATELSSDDVLLAVRYLNTCGLKIRSEISYESRYLELVFVLDAHQIREMR